MKQPDMMAEKESVIPGKRDTKHPGPETRESLAFSRNRKTPLICMCYDHVTFKQ